VRRTSHSEHLKQPLWYVLFFRLIDSAGYADCTGSRAGRPQSTCVSRGVASGFVHDCTGFMLGVGYCQFRFVGNCSESDVQGGSRAGGSQEKRGKGGENAMARPCNER